MPNTPAPTSLPFPGTSPAPNVPADMQALADRLHTFLTTSENVAGITAATGWSINSPTSLRRFGALVYLTLEATYTASTAIGSGTNQNIPNTHVATLPVGYRPLGPSVNFAFVVPADTFGMGQIASSNSTVPGQVFLNEMLANTDIAQNQVVLLTAVFPAA